MSGKLSHVNVSQQAALAAIRDTVGLWHAGQGSAADIVYSACDLLVAGLDGPALRMLAAASIEQADFEVPDLEAALHDVGLPYEIKGSPARPTRRVDSHGVADALECGVAQGN